MKSASSNGNSRVFKAKTPLRVILTAVLIAGGVVAFIIFATYQSAKEIIATKKTGLIVDKEFRPAPERQIIVDRKGSLTTDFKDGYYFLTVEVPQPDGTKKKYYVELQDKSAFEALKVGDSYDVGPYLIPEKK